MILIAHSFFLCRDSKQNERFKPYPPLTTLLAAAILRDRGHRVALFDATFEASAKTFGDALDRIEPSIVLLVEDNFNFLTKMCTETRRRDALEMVREAHRRGCKVAVNGPDASDEAGLYLEAGADAVLVGEGEFGIADLVEAFGSAGDALEQTSGLILRDASGRIQQTKRRPQQHELDSLPLPAWDLVDADAYRQAWMKAHDYFSWNMAASRGCPYSCNWCAKPTFGRRYIQRSPASVAEEMRRLKTDIAPHHIWFADDIFGMTEQWILAFAREVAARGALIPFMMQSRANLITPRVAEALRAAGAEEVWLGVESGSQKILNAMDKGISVENARLATRTLKDHGIRAGWFLQLGYPSEEWEDILMTRDLVRDEAPDEVGISVSYPLPGTVFYERVAAQLGARRNWRDTDDLAMLFHGTYDSAFYRLIRDALHAAVTTHAVDEEVWEELARRAEAHRTPAPERFEFSA